jgi:hypothetical protein
VPYSTHHQGPSRPFFGSRVAPDRSISVYGMNFLSMVGRVNVHAWKRDAKSAARFTIRAWSYACCRPFFGGLGRRRTTRRPSRNSIGGPMRGSTCGSGARRGGREPSGSIAGPGAGAGWPSGPLAHHPLPAEPRRPPRGFLGFEARAAERLMDAASKFVVNDEFDETEALAACRT